MKHGQAFKAGRYGSFHYFATQDLASAYAQRLGHQLVVAPVRNKRPAKAIAPATRLRSTLRPGDPRCTPSQEHPAAPVTLRTPRPAPTLNPVIPPNVKITRLPAPPGRFEMAGPVVGGFATMRPGKYLEETGFSRYLEGGQK
jgi:hypothetical protein